MLRRAALALLLLCSLSASAQAHGLGVQCRLQGEQIEVEAYFTDNTAAKDALVRVTDVAGNVVAQGRTDAEGRWSFPKPQPGRYRVVADAGDGHVRHVNLTEDFLSDAPSREEFTASPWPKIVIGVAALLALGFGFRFARRRR